MHKIMVYREWTKDGDKTANRQLGSYKMLAKVTLVGNAIPPMQPSKVHIKIRSKYIILRMIPL